MQWLSGTLLLVVSVALSCILNGVHAKKPACPPAEAILPCTCNPIDRKTSIKCSNVKTPDALREIFESNPNLQFDRLFIENSSLSYIPSSIFETARFRNLYVYNSSFDTLFDSPPSSNILDSILIDGVALKQGLDWRLFSNLTVREIILDNTIVREIGRSFWEGIPDTLEDFYLYKSNITSIQPQTFENFEKKIKMIDISRGLLKELDYNIFPETIRELLLDNNRIETLPDGIFDYLPNLGLLSMKGNLLTTIQKEVFANIERVVLEDNPIQCDCRIQWVLETKNVAWTKCAGPEAVKGKLVEDLTENDFSDCKSFANNEIV